MRVPAVLLAAYLLGLSTQVTGIALGQDLAAAGSNENSLKTRAFIRIKPKLKPNNKDAPEYGIGANKKCKRSWLGKRMCYTGGEDSRPPTPEQIAELTFEQRGYTRQPVEDRGANPMNGEMGDKSRYLEDLGIRCKGPEARAWESNVVRHKNQPEMQDNILDYSINPELGVYISKKSYPVAHDPLRQAGHTPPPYPMKAKDLTKDNIVEAMGTDGAKNLKWMVRDNVETVTSVNAIKETYAGLGKPINEKLIIDGDNTAAIASLSVENPQVLATLALLRDPVFEGLRVTRWHVYTPDIGKVSTGARRNHRAGTPGYYSIVAELGH